MKSCGLHGTDIALLNGPFYFLRHGETELNRLGLIAGSADVPLNETGRKQARAAAERLAAIGIDAGWSSPMQRALDTARCVAQALDLEIRVIEELAERNWGALEGTPRAARISEAPPPGGEALEVFRERTLRGLKRIAPSRAPLVVAHSGTYRVLVQWLGLPPLTAPIANSMPLRLRRDGTQDGVWLSERA